MKNSHSCLCQNVQNNLFKLFATSCVKVLSGKSVVLTKVCLVRCANILRKLGKNFVAKIATTTLSHVLCTHTYTQIISFTCIHAQKHTYNTKNHIHKYIYECKPTYKDS